MLFSVLFAAIGALVGWRYSFVFIITLSSCIAAYLIVRGSTFWYNAGYPNELTLLNAASSEMNGLYHIPRFFFVYVILIIALSFFGARR